MVARGKKRSRATAHSRYEVRLFWSSAEVGLINSLTGFKDPRTLIVDGFEIFCGWNV